LRDLVNIAQFAAFFIEIGIDLVVFPKEGAITDRNANYPARQEFFPCDRNLVRPGFKVIG